MHVPSKVVFLACFLLVGQYCLPQPSVSFEKLTVEDGLSQGYVSTILQDKEGFLWIGTRSGLNRFDGYEFKVYNHAPLDSFSLSGNAVLSIVEMGDLLLVSTIGNGLNVFDKKTERFTRIIAEGELSKWLQTGSLAYASLDKEGNLWSRVKALDQQYHLLEMTFEKVQDGRLRVEKHRQWPFENGFQINMSHNGAHLWGGDYKNLFQVNLKSGELDFFEVPSEPRSVTALDDGSVIFMDNDRLALFNGKDWRWKTLDYRPRRLFLTKEGGEILVSSKGSIRDRISVPNMLKYFDSLEKNELIELGDCEIICAFVDHSGLLWIGTNGYGLIKLDPRLQQFNVHLPTESIMSPVLVDKNGHFQFASNRRNDWAVKITNHSLHNFPYPKNPQVAYQIDPKGNEWALSSLKGQLELFRKKAMGGAWERLLQVACEDSLILGKLYNQFSFDGEGNIWIAHQQHLKKFNPENGAWRDFSFEDLIPNEHETNALAGTADGSWWLAAEFGLLQAKPNGENLIFKLHQAQEGPLNGILNDHVSHLLTDRSDPYILWITTLGGGLSKLDVRNLKFKHVTLPDNVIYAIYQDSKGWFWMSSNQGIFR
ncbi:MAG: two-component regulator propeller domain-containing protein, partial [Saprospiraceae bacterium]